MYVNKNTEQFLKGLYKNQCTHTSIERLSIKLKKILFKPVVVVSVVYLTKVYSFLSYFFILYFIPTSLKSSVLYAIKKEGKYTYKVIFKFVSIGHSYI